MSRSAPPAPDARTAGASPARRCAHAVLRRVFAEGAYADRALEAEAARAGLDPRERALATALAYGAVQRRGTLDHLAATLSKRPPAELDPAVLDALRLGLLQLLFLDGVPAHAAVDQSVELAKDGSRGGHRLVNAVLRRAAREGRALLDSLDDSTPEGAALRHSHPGWLAERWFAELGAGEARALMAADDEPAEHALRANALVTTPEALVEELDRAGVAAHRPGPAPESLILDGAWDAHGSPLWAAGAFAAQSRASAFVSRTVDPQPGERVLDLCAAPGGKTTHLAALMQGEGEVIAVERDVGRAQRLRKTCRRMRATGVEVVEADAREPVDGSFDRVLVDPPCSGLGTLRSRPDLRWRMEPEDVEELAALQARILAAGAAATRPGGTLVYSTCTISAAENERVVDAFLDAHPDWSADDLQSDTPLWKHASVPSHLQTVPHRDGTDGFFIARLRRAEEG